MAALTLVDLFRRGEASREVRLAVATGTVAPTGREQAALLVVLMSDDDPEIRAAATATIEALPASALAAVLAAHDLPPDVRAYFVARGVAPAQQPRTDDAPLVDRGDELDIAALEAEFERAIAAQADVAPHDTEDGTAPRQTLSSMPVIDRIKLAIRGSRQQRAVLIRDTNRIVATAVLSSPKLNDSEVESFARMGNVSEDILRAIAANRSWTRNYGVIAALTRNSKTPLAVSMPFVSRLNERDLRSLSTDRNVPEGLRVAARKLVVASDARRR